jgi:protein SCO1/2
VAGVGLAAPGAAKTSDAGRTSIPNIEVVDQDGRSHRFYDDLVKDKVVLLNFFFTSCGDTCPLVTENLRAVQDLLGDRMGRDIFMLSVSLQPELETPAILKDYAKIWEVRPGWSFLTGRPAEIERLRRATGFASADPDYDLILDNHTGILRYGNARLNRWAGTPGLARPAWIAKAVTSIAGPAA